jgi:hypothetical protein
VVVDARTQERELLARVDVPRSKLLEVRDDLLLRERRLEIELAVETHARWNVAEQLVDRVDADRREHLVAVALCQGEEAHCSATKAW